MNIVEKTIWGIDRFQRRHKLTAFAFAVNKKYQDDQAGYQAALVTYYGFLSLFPLLLIIMTIASLVGVHNPALRTQIIDAVSDYFPALGKTLEDSVHSPHSSGIALAIGILLSLYGARGIADAFRHAANQIWHIPLSKRSGFPRSLIRSLGLIIGGGIGFVAASIIATSTAAAGHGWVFWTLSLTGNVVVLYFVFLYIMRLSLPLAISVRQFRTGALISSVGLMILQQLGGLIIKKITPTAYSALFATTLGLVAWIYLQARLVMYAMVVDTIRAYTIWPRSLSGKQPTAADKYMDGKRSQYPLHK